MTVGTEIGAQQPAHRTPIAVLGVTATDTERAIAELKADILAGAAAAAPKTAEYLVSSADATLTAERITTNTPSIIWDHATAGQAKAVRAALTGDISAAQDSNVTTLTTVNANVGSFGLAASVAQFTVNAKGLITAAANVAIQIAISAVTGLQLALDAKTNAADLASTSNGLGASLVGIEDSGGLITATNVEGALAEHRALINALDAAVILKGTWDASGGSFPGAGVAQAGWSYIVSVSGTVDGVAFVANDRILAIADNASASTYAANWHKLDYTDQVLSVAGKTGAVTLDKNDVGLGNVTNDAQLKIASNLSDVANAATAFGNIKQGATDTATGVVELAIASELNTGTDTARAVTPDALAGSNYGVFCVSILVFDDSQNMAVADGAGDVFWRVPSFINGWDLVSAHASVQTAGTTSTALIQVRNVTQAADMLSTRINIDTGELDSKDAATQPVIDASNDDVATGDQLRIDVDQIHTTPAKGLLVELVFRVPT